jgi:hypothetical protein
MADLAGPAAIMANHSIPGPLGHNPKLADTDVSLWCDLGCHRGHTPGPIRVAEGPMDKSKKPAKAARTATIKTIIFHIYVPIIPVGDTPGNKGYSVQDFIDWFKAPDDPRIPDVGKWSNESVDLEFFIKTKSGVADIKNSLQREGAIVVYIGHSTLTRPKSPKDPEGPSLGLSPDNPRKGPEIPNTNLRALLSKSKASLVIIASCDSKTAVGNLSAGPPIIVTNSGTDRVTLIPRMANAVATFLFLLIGWERDRQEQPNNPHKGDHGTIDEALAASAAEFKDMDDRFELVHGDGSIKLFPDSP